MNNFIYFRGSFLVTLAGMIAAYFIGGLSAVFIVSVLMILEVSLSFDNAVVNAKILKDMDAIWRKRFLTWGILIAVFGMRIIFPVVIVSVIAGVSPLAAINIAVNEPDLYQQHMESSHIAIMGFGGAFLMMVALDFFFDDEKDHWIPFIEQPIVHLGKVKFAAEVITLLAIMGIALSKLADADEMTFIYSGLAGLLTFTAINKLSNWIESSDAAEHEASEVQDNIEVQKSTDNKPNSADVVANVAKSGLVMFMYLEVLDASFSFDGVIGAFAITTDLFIIAIGLGVGAMFVRSLTIMLVEKGTLAEYRYLEHGAFYAIIALAAIMFLKTFMHVPEVITGLIGAGFIIVAMLHSIKDKSDSLG